MKRILFIVFTFVIGCGNGETESKIECKTIDSDLVLTSYNRKFSPYFTNMLNLPIGYEAYLNLIEDTNTYKVSVFFNNTLVVQYNDIYTCIK